MTDERGHDGDQVGNEAPPSYQTTDPAADPKRSDPIPAVGIFVLFLLTIVGGLALVAPFRAAQFQAFEDPASLTNVIVIVVEVLVATLAFLVAFRYDRGKLVAKVVVLGAMVYLLAFPVFVLLPQSVPAPWIVAGGVSLLAGVVLWIHPEWYVIDLAGIGFGAAAIALFGGSLSPVPIMALLVLMATYDAYSVYVSEHMQSLGSGIVDLRLPMVFVVPATVSFSMREVETLDELGANAMLLGLGDAIFPGLLAASAATFVDAAPVIAGLNAPALGAFVGALVGMVGLEVLLYVIRRTHAGLPVLTACVLAGYLVGVLVSGLPLSAAFGV